MLSLQSRFRFQVYFEEEELLRGQAGSAQIGGAGLLLDLLACGCIQEPWSSVGGPLGFRSLNSAACSVS